MAVHDHDYSENFFVPLVEYSADVIACNSRSINVLDSPIWTVYVGIFAYLPEIGAQLNYRS